MKIATHLCALAGLLIALSCLTPGQPAAPLTHDAYVWQQQWQPAVSTAILQNRDLVRAWRILLLHVDSTGNAQAIHPDFASLQASQRPVIVVVRIEGQIRHFDENALRQQILQALRRLRELPFPLAGLEIDHDCARSQLPRYAGFLRQLRDALPPDLPFSITALPDWLASPHLQEVLAPTTESVLQVHAVTNPRDGLFDPRQAGIWIRRYAEVSPHPFRVALPIYGTQLRFDQYGNLASVQSETPLLGGAAITRELIVSPTEIQAFLRQLQHRHPPQLAGFVWFRLPVAGDSRAWDAQTWRTVVTGRPLNGKLEVTLRRHNDESLLDIFLRNQSNIDIERPWSISLPNNCQVADGLNGYEFFSTGRIGPVLRRKQSGLIHPGQEISIGWARCSLAPGSDPHASP